MEPSPPDPPPPGGEASTTTTSAIPPPTDIDISPPNFFCRPGRSRRKATQSEHDASESPNAGDADPPRLAFVHAIVDHHTRARETRHQRARLDASTNAWNMPVGGQDRRQQEGSSSSAQPQSTSTSYTGTTHSTTSTDITSPSGSPPRASPPADDAASSKAAPPADPQEEPPWFSQLASLPHLRSAGVPLQPSNTTTKDDSSASKTASSIIAPTLQPLTDEELQPLQPPDNFAMVNSWLYRSSFPKKKHFPFLKTLGLKSVLTLILEEYPDQNTKFLDEEGITFFQFGIPGNKEPFVQIPSDKIASALLTILDRRNHPMLIHCNKGKHRTGCLIGCLRKLQDWSLTIIFDEYRRFSHPKSRSMDQEFIELFDVEMVWAHLRGAQASKERVWLPKWRVLLDRSDEERDEAPPESDMRGM